MSTKSKGTRNEHRTMKYLESRGYSCSRTAASLGAWDVFAVSAHNVKLIQVKSNRWPGSVEMQTMQDFSCPPEVSKEVWRWDDYAREPKIRRLE